MSERVSDIASFVFRNGEIASEIVFGNTEEGSEVPGLSEAERAAIEKAWPHLEATWTGILDASREALWKHTDAHPCGPAARTIKTRTSKMFENGEFQVPLVPGKATCGVTLEAWGEPQYHLFLWCWAHARYRAEAEPVVAQLGLKIWRNNNGSFLLTLPAPAEGELYEDIGRRVAEQLWALARPVAEVVAASKL